MLLRISPRPLRPCEVRIDGRPDHENCVFLQTAKRYNHSGRRLPSMSLEVSTEIGSRYQICLKKVDSLVLVH